MDKKKIMLIIVFIVLGIILYIGVSLIRLSRQVAGYRQYWTELVSKVPPTDALTYVALGDSAAQGVGASNPMNGYVGLIAHDLENSAGKSVHIINISVSGAKIADVTKTQLPKLERLGLNSDAVITLAVGANNMQDYRSDKFKKDIDDLYRQLPAWAVVADIPYFGSGFQRSKENQVIEANVIIHEIANKYNLKVARLHDSTKNNDKLGVHSYDFFHPSDKGYQNWFEAFRQEL